MRCEQSMQNLICGGNFPRPGKAGAQDKVSRSVPDTILSMRDRAGPATLICGLQGYLEGEKEVKQIQVIPDIFHWK